MNNDEETLEAYIALEKDVQKIIRSYCSKICEICTACCCRADICEESLQSAFLSRLIEKQGISREDMNERFGWLDQNGCSLRFGRPPVCYTFFCDELLAGFSDEDARYVMRILGRLIEYVGEDVVNNLHLVEIMNPQQLNSVDFSMVGSRIEKAEIALGVIRRFLETGRLGQAERRVLDAIGLSED